jgi:uncharacterized protein YndB with AHSA1/START domain
VDKNEQTVVMTRFFAAPRRRVFEAWTRAEHLEKWFGPTGFTITDCQCDPRPGGVFRLCMRSPAGEAYRVRGSFREVTPPERLVIACTMDDPQGVPRIDELIEAEFQESGRGTKLNLNSTARGPGAVAATMLARFPKGWTQTVERLSDLMNPKPTKEM